MEAAGRLPPLFSCPFPAYLSSFVPSQRRHGCRSPCPLPPLRFVSCHPRSLDLSMAASVPRRCGSSGSIVRGYDSFRERKRRGGPSGCLRSCLNGMP